MWGPLLKVGVKPILGRILSPALRILVGLIAVPVFQFLLRHVFRVQEMDEELEKDLEQWFKASLVLLAATKNAEDVMFGWILGDPSAAVNFKDAIVVGMRLFLVIGVIESMPDQELFPIIHPGPDFKYDRKKGLFQCVREQWRAWLKGVVCQHLNRSSPVFAILSAVFSGPTGWICFGIAITQYLIIGLVTSRDRALDILSEFDKQVAIRRRQLVDEFDMEDVAKEQQKRRDENPNKAISPIVEMHGPPPPTNPPSSLDVEIAAPRVVEPNETAE